MRISPAATVMIGHVYRMDMSVEELVEASGCSDWRVHAFLATRCFEETATTLYVAGYSGPGVAEVMHTTIGRVSYYLGKVRARRGLRWLRQLRD